MVRGVDLSPVEARSRVKSILASKSFHAVATHTAPTLAKYCAVICEEIATRVKADTAKFGRRPCRLCLYFRSSKGVHRSKVVHTTTFTDPTYV